ncbi:hypothetical protein GK047_21650 [Paenibacillus sp. SYP-B3998]|uniref:Prolipoprotein diacylglyceryl transferase n=1 Tax=Paenibacillus sp. SYP-B3998 TaxID=2678564 RepID=A0A6G4A3U1_9BACL|nr:prolipoprotein diacylglyceryl transferase family protein [Paenibacillus sp. SYP-B3998]NEW08604.1 hypothetical protein [Paenibacillus sp. SYP-B3998]
MNDVIQFGPFMIRTDLLLLFIAGFFSYFLLTRYFFRESTFNTTSVLDKTLNAIFIIFFSWKLSPILSQPSILWKNPLSVIIMSGSELGIWIGLSIVFIYLYRELKRLQISYLFYFDFLSVGLLMVIFIYQWLGWRYGSLTSLPWGISIEDPSFKYHPLNIYVLFATLPMLIFAYINKKKLGDGKLFINVLTSYMVGLMLITLFKGKTNFVLGLSKEQLIYLILILIGVILANIKLRKQQQNQTEVEGKESHHVNTGVLPSNSGDAAVNEVRP